MEVKALMLLDCSPQVWCSLQTPGSGFLLTQTPEDSSDGSSHCTPDTHVEDGVVFPSLSFGLVGKDQVVEFWLPLCET